MYTQCEQLLVWKGYFGGNIAGMKSKKQPQTGIKKCFTNSTKNNMDYIKLGVYNITLIFLLGIFFLSCSSFDKAKEKIDLVVWNESTKKFIGSKCDSLGLLQKELVPVFSYSDSLVFSNLNMYIDYRLNFRSIIEKYLSNNISIEDFTKIRVEEFYNEGSSSARVITTNHKTKKLGITIIRQGGEIKYADEVELSRYTENSYNGDCILALSNSMITRMTIVTDFISPNDYVTQFASLY